MRFTINYNNNKKGERTNSMYFEGSLPKFETIVKQWYKDAEVIEHALVNKEHGWILYKNDTGIHIDFMLINDYSPDGYTIDKLPEGSTFRFYDIPESLFLQIPKGNVIDSAWYKHMSLLIFRRNLNKKRLTKGLLFKLNGNTLFKVDEVSKYHIIYQDMNSHKYKISKHSFYDSADIIDDAVTLNQLTLI
mgnify:CR=1 FL=1